MVVYKVIIHCPYTHCHFNNIIAIIFEAIMKKKFLFIAILFIIGIVTVHAQDTLPNFTVRNVGAGKAQISWINNFEKVVQLTVQRSFDSSKFFRTIFSSQSPWLPQNGFIDNNLPDGYKVYYRIQYVFDGGAYFFTKAKSPAIYKSPVIPDDVDPVDPPKKDEVRIVKIYRRTKDSLVTTINYKEYRHFKDSVSRTTKDTLYYYDNDEVIIKPYIPKPIWKASTYVYTNDKGYVKVILPLAKQKHYRIVFFEENGNELFQIKHVKEAELLLDKVNFIHAGWFSFELYEDEKLKEKNKFYLWKD